MERAAANLRADLQRPPTLEELAEHLEVTAEELDQDLLALHTCRVLSIDEGCNAGGSTPGHRLAAHAADPATDAEHRETVAALTRAVGELLGVSESRVSQILARATERLRLRMKSGWE